jgi:hypothetical protein
MSAIKGVADVLIFVKLEDGTVHQVIMSKQNAITLLERGWKLITGPLAIKPLALCEKAEPIEWERPEEK